MRLTFAIKSMNRTGGGAERVMADVVNGLAGRGHDVSLLTFDCAGGESFYPLDPRVQRIELDIGPVDHPSSLPVVLRRLPAIRAAVQKARPDVTVGFMHSMFIPMGMALAGSGVPIVASEHIVPSHYRSRPLEWALLRLAPLYVHTLVCVSPQAREFYPPSLRRKMVPIANPVTLSVTGRAKVSGGTRNMLLSVGRLEPQKDHATLIRAFAKISADLPDWNLTIVGDGVLRGELTDLIDSLGLHDRVHLPGATQNIAAAYLESQLFVQPSRYESFGLTTAEALAHGLPAVGFVDCPGTNMLIKNGENGALALADDDRPAALADALRRLMADADLRRHCAEMTRGSLANNQIDVVLDDWEALLSDVSKHPAPGTPAS
ncbi:MAG: glycosyltransferase family 4 protein [Rhodospirillales bacterium]